MTVVYSNTFESETTGALPANWANVSPAVAQVTTTSPVKGSKSLGQASTVDGNVAMYSGNSSLTDQDVSLVTAVAAVVASNASTAQPVVRGSSDGQNHYVVVAQVTNLVIYKRVSGSYTAIATVAHGLTITTGTVLWLRLQATGTTIRARVWIDGNTEPTGWTASATDSTYSSGSQGVRFGWVSGGGTTQQVNADTFAVDDLVTAATALTLTGPSSGNTGSPSTNFTVTANGTLSSSVTVTPSDASGGGTFTPTTLTLNSGTLSGTFTYTPASNGAKTISISNSGSLTNPSSLTYTASTPSSATAITLTGPTTGSVGVASTAFTVGANGTISGSVVVTPSDSGAGGTFTPGSVTINTGSPTATFTYTASAAGTDTISVTNNGSLTNPSTISYVASALATFAVTNTNIFFSPYNWFSDGGGSLQANNVKGSSTFAWSNNRGAYFRFKATVGASGSITLGVDTTSLASVSNPAGCPNLAWSVGGGAEQTVLLASGNTSVTLATGLSAGTYEVFVCFKSVFITQDGDIAGCFTTPNNRVQVTGLTLSTGGTLSAPTLKPKRMAVFGDSITETDRLLSLTRSATSQDAKRGYAWLLSEALNAEVGIVGWYGQIWAFFATSWDHQSAANSRLGGGLLLPAPDYIVINYGENDGNPGPLTTAVNPVLAAIRTAAPSSLIVLNVPFSGKARTNLALATLPSNAILTDLARPEMAPGNLQWSFDGQHPNFEGSPNLGALLAQAINTQNPNSGSGTVQALGLGGLALTAQGKLVLAL